MIKLIVSDMDGTLLNDEKQIDKRIYDLLPKMREEGSFSPAFIFPFCISFFI